MGNLLQQSDQLRCDSFLQNKLIPEQVLYSRQYARYYSLTQKTTLPQSDHIC